MMLSFRRVSTSALFLVFVALISVSPADAQDRVGRDSATRLTRFGRDVAYVTLTSFGWAAWDQTQNDPPEWGKDWPGYRHRLYSNVGKSVIQESVTQGIAAVMNRPLDY